MRVAFGNTQKGVAYASCAEYWCSLDPGINYFAFDVNSLTTLRGDPDYSRINTIAFGGATANNPLAVWLTADNGATLL